MASRQTLVQDVRNALLSDLRAGRHRVGDKIPNEAELAQRFNVSRATLREAVQGLLEAGYLSRAHGRGTFVTGVPRHRHSLDMTVSYTTMIKEAGMTPAEIVLARSQRPADAHEAELLGLDVGAPLVWIERVRTADGTPAIYSEDRLPKALLGDMLDAPLDRSLYVFFADAGLAIHHALATLRPVVADRRLARLLGVSRGSALQQIEQVDFTAKGAAAMLSSEWHVPGVFELSINRRPVTGSDHEDRDTIRVGRS